ncbi:MAG: nuclear transport factor 2 family protein [Microthrixaceae bacterium]
MSTPTPDDDPARTDAVGPDTTSHDTAPAPTPGASLPTDGHADGLAGGRVLDPARVADHLAIQDLATAYAYAVDDRDWARWEQLFTPGAQVDYTAAGGIAGTAAQVAAWMSDAMAIFSFCQHTTATHEIRFTGPDTATGRVHVFNRNGVEWEGRSEIFDVSAIYEDTYQRVGDGWRISGRTERTLCMTDGAFADMIRDMASGD